MQAGFEQFRGAVDRINGEKAAAIEKTTVTVTWVVVGIATLLVALLAVLSYAIVTRSVVLRWNRRAVRDVGRRRANQFDRFDGVHVVHSASKQRQNACAQKRISRGDSI